MDYTTLSPGDKLLLARDALRGKESDHFRTSLLTDDPGQEQRLAQLEAEILRLREDVAFQEDATVKEQERITAEERARIARESQESDQPQS